MTDSLAVTGLFWKSSVNIDLRQREKARLAASLLDWLPANDVYAVIDRRSRAQFITDPAIGCAPLRRRQRDMAALASPC
jgi:hypothetical protein